MLDEMGHPGIPLSVLSKAAEIQLLYTVDKVLLGNRWLRKATGIQPKFPYMIDSFQRKYILYSTTFFSVFLFWFNVLSESITLAILPIILRLTNTCWLWGDTQLLLIYMIPSCFLLSIEVLKHV